MSEAQTELDKVQGRFSKKVMGGILICAAS